MLQKHMVAQVRRMGMNKADFCSISRCAVGAV